MLTRADEKTAAALMPLLDRMPEAAVRQSALLGAYGTGRGFFNVWIQNDYAAVISRLETSFSVLDLGGLDAEESAFFLDFNPYFRRLSGSSATVGNISGLLGARYTIERVNLMRLKTELRSISGQITPVGQFALDRQPKLRAVFDLIAGVLPQEAEYPAWYADLNHRMRHGCARAYLLLCGGEPVCAGLVSAESATAGLISGIATKREFRGRGFATYVIASICADLAAGGKVPVLECYDSLMPFYEGIGFEKLDDISELEVENM